MPPPRPRCRSGGRCAGRPERGVPERRVARRRAVVRAHVQVRIGDVIVTGRGAVVDRARGDADVEVLRPQHRGARPVAGYLGGEPAQRLRAQLVPLRQQAGGPGVDHQRLVRVQRGSGLVHPGRGAGPDAGELGGRPEGGQGGPPGRGGVADDEFGAGHGEEPAVRAERRSAEAARRRNQADLPRRGVPGGGKQVLRDAVRPVPGGGHAGGRAVSAADHGCHGCSVSPGAPTLRGQPERA
jgi:hypothetical protein